MGTAITNPIELYGSVDFDREIKFRWFQPDDSFPTGILFSITQQLLSRLGFSLESRNTVFPTLSAEHEEALQKLCRIPKASTFAIGALINQLVASLKPDEVFLNIGVWHGFTFLSGLLKNPNQLCIGVDNFSVHQKVDAKGHPEYQGMKRFLYRQVDRWARSSFLKRFELLRTRRHYFVEIDYVEYFRKVHKHPIGFYLYDAQHRYKDQLLALQLAEPFMKPGCLILIDDTNSEDNYAATLDFIKQSKHHYQILMDVKTAGNRHPTFWNGLILFRKMN